MPFLQVERTGLRGVHDREAEGGALVGAGDVRLTTDDRERVIPQADADDRFADLAFRAAGAGVGLCFAAQRYAGEQARDTGWVMQRDLLDLLLTIFTTQRRHQRREPARLDVRRL